ncbi:MAG TPA: Na+/H+ antiporter subunit E [Candidatus Acidoferrales bacterium]|nr:Na+/H+ antiporter subunit E [Candidatus Acidoferrales bacterium]
MRTPVERDRKKSIRNYLLTWLFQWILWLVFANSLGWREQLIGALMAALGTYFTRIFATETEVNFKFRWRDVAQVIHIPELLFSDAWILLVAIKRELLGQKTASGILSVRFRCGGLDSASRGRRALVITLLTLTPNNLVLGISSDTQLLFFHTVIPRPLPKFLGQLGAEL